jgi:hypothetical protein
MIEPIKKCFECKVCGKVSEDGDGENDDGETESGIRKVQQFIEPLEGFVNEIGCRNQRDNEQRSTEEISDESSEEAVIHDTNLQKQEQAKLI